MTAFGVTLRDGDRDPGVVTVRDGGQVAKAAQAELDRLRVAAEGSVDAAMALTLAGRLDEALPSASAPVARALGEVMARLRAGAERPASSPLDEVRAAREKRQQRQASG